MASLRFSQSGDGYSSLHAASFVCQSAEMLGAEFSIQEQEGLGSQVVIRKEGIRKTPPRSEKKSRHIAKCSQANAACSYGTLFTRTSVSHTCCMIVLQCGATTLELQLPQGIDSLRIKIHTLIARGKQCWAASEQAELA